MWARTEAILERAATPPATSQITAARMARTWSTRNCRINRQFWTNLLIKRRSTMKKLKDWRRRIISWSNFWRIVKNCIFRSSMRQSSKAQVSVCWSNSFGPSSRWRWRTRHCWWTQSTNVCSRCQMAARTCQLLRSLKTSNCSAKRSRKRIWKTSRAQNHQTTCQPETTAPMFRTLCDKLRLTLRILESPTKSK